MLLKLIELDGSKSDSQRSYWVKGKVTISESDPIATSEWLDSLHHNVSAITNPFKATDELATGPLLRTITNSTVSLLDRT